MEDQLIYVVDFATARAGFELRLTEVIPAEAQRVVVLIPAHEQYRAHAVPNPVFVVAEHISAGQQANEVISEELQAGRVCFLSLDAHIRTAMADRFRTDVFAGKLNIPYPPVISLPRESTQALRPIGGSSVPFDATDWPMTRVSLDAALEAFRAVLVTRRAFDQPTAMFLTDARTLLPVQHADFDLTQCQETRVPGFMRRLAITAAKAGKVDYSFVGAGRDCVWLKNPQGASEALVAAAPLLAPAAALTTPVASTVAPNFHEAYQVIHAKDSSLRDRLKDLYTTATWGPFTNLRPQLYSSVRACVGKGPRPLAKLVDEVVQELCTMLPKDSKGETGKQIRLPIREIRRFVWNLLASDAVLIEEGSENVVIASFPSTLIRGVVEDLELRLDQAIVNFWFTTGGDLPMVDLHEFCRFLMPGSPVEREERVLAILESLRRSGSLAFSVAEQKLTFRGQQGANVVDLQSKRAA